MGKSERLGLVYTVATTCSRLPWPRGDPEVMRLRIDGYLLAMHVARRQS